ncbi:hypothetical protein [Dysgonomonas macrotermitis]|uniref:Uncharacterized protein n=1 Tax=Dysgonomonas macrotermitis TaxID=1346286 RepID=A0A1M5C979_9BACT|nr:hypothetical protein [Dysgonomonas macrotermitis]SHF51334.1 hypothetical protein SAMN05444362_10781 [Dysgonomonas macrotermitis]
MNKYTSYIIILFALIGCSDDTPEVLPPPLGQSFYLLDKDGDDLLDPQSEKAIDAKKINIYYLVNGERIEANRYFLMLNFPTLNYGFGITAPNSANNKSHYYINIALNQSGNNGDTLYTYVEWNENDIDTIKSKIYKKGKVFDCTMVAYNDSVWTPNQLENRTIFTIIKP